MTRIVYKLKGDWGEAREISGSSGTLAIIIDSAIFGYVTIGGVTSEITDGMALFDISRIDDGEYTPLVSGEVHARLEPIRKTGDKITLLPTPDETIRRLMLRLELAEEKISTLSLRIDNLSQLYGKQVIF